MNLLEILNTNPKIQWKQKHHQHFGKFELEGAEFTIQLDEFEVNGKTLVDFGFVTEGSHLAKEGNKPAAKVIGAVLNGAVPKIKEINPEFILIAVDKSSGLVESRKSIYDALHRLLQRNLDFTYASDWVENSKAFYKIFGRKQKPSNEEIELFLSQVNMKL